MLFDPNSNPQVDPTHCPGVARNSPFRGMELPGQVVATFFRGTATVLEGDLQW